MKIAVISPCHRAGISTISTLLGYCLTWTQQMSTVISYSDISDVGRYIGSSALDDKTRNISQLNKLLAAGALSPDNITEYCVPLLKDLWLLDTTSNIITIEEKAKLLEFIFDRVPTDNIVCDVGGDIYEPTTKALLSIADVIVIVFEPYRTSFDAVKNYMNSNLLPKNKNYMYLCNRYDDVIIPLREVTRDLGVKHINMCKLHYNPWICKLSEMGRLDELMPQVIQKDVRVLNLNNDMREWMSYIQGLNNNKVRWEV